MLVCDVEESKHARSCMSLGTRDPCVKISLHRRTQTSVKDCSFTDVNNIAHHSSAAKNLDLIPVQFVGGTQDLMKAQNHESK